MNGLIIRECGDTNTSHRFRRVQTTGKYGTKVNLVEQLNGS